MNDHGRDPRYKMERRVRAAELYRSGLTEHQVAKELGVSRSVARSYLNDAGVRRRRRGPKRSKPRRAGRS